jgi:hypothetical protein
MQSSIGCFFCGGRLTYSLRIPSFTIVYANVLNIFPLEADGYFNVGSKLFIACGREENGKARQNLQTGHGPQ